MDNIQKWPLDFITKEQLEAFVRKMVKVATIARERVSNDPYKSVIDPFSALVDAAVQGITLEQWMEQEKSRQMQKALQNAVGDFHQDVIGAMPGWDNAGRGGSYDVINKEKKIIAEIKNKYNTLNSGGKLNLYDKLAKHLDYGSEGDTAYYVAVITKQSKPYNRPFTPTERKNPRPSRQDLREMDGRSFYDFVSGEQDALKKLYEALPPVLEDILGRPLNMDDPSSYISEAVEDGSAVEEYVRDPDFVALFRRAFG